MAKVDPRFFRAWQRLVVLAQPPVRPSQAKVRSTTQRRGSTWPWLRGGAHQIADQSSDVFWYESPDLATRLTLIHEEGRTSRCPRVLTDERG